jgi:hypothetical protein
MFVRKTITLTTDGSGDASGKLGVGKRYCVLRGVQVADAQFDDSYTIQITDSDGRELFQSASITAAVDKPIVEENVLLDDGTAGATDGQFGALVARTPLNVIVAAGGATQTGTIKVYVEV